MLLPYSKGRTKAQKWLILCSAVVSIVLVSAAVFYYEHHHRLPSESIFFGTWKMSLEGDEDKFYRFNPDQTFSLQNGPNETVGQIISGKWYAGGSNLYLRYNPDQMHEPTQVIVWPVQSVGPTEFIVQWDYGPRLTLRRVNTSTAPE